MGQGHRHVQKTLVKPSEKFPKTKSSRPRNRWRLPQIKSSGDTPIDQADKLFNSEDYALAIDKYKAAAM